MLAVPQMYSKAMNTGKMKFPAPGAEMRFLGAVKRLDRSVVLSVPEMLCSVPAPILNCRPEVRIRLSAVSPPVRDWPAALLV